jgi:hypothetical protein
MNVGSRSVPFPLRVAAGLAVTAAEQARGLPGRVVGLPVTVASRAMQTAMRMQQEVTTLAIKGDDALSTFRPAQETPPWAMFDEDAPDDADPSPGGEPEEGIGDLRFGAPLTERGAPGRPSGATVTSIDGTGAGGFASSSTEARPVEPGAIGAGGADGRPGPAGVEDPWLSEQRELSRTHADGEGDSDSRAGPPAAFPNYDELNLPQLRARLRRFSLADLHELLDYERAHGNRSEFTKMLAKRIDTVRAEQ